MSFRMAAMKAIAINGSPHMDEGNTAMILNPFLEGLKEAGCDAELFYTRKLKIGPCNGDMSCWFINPGVCAQKDDMEILAPRLKEADIIIFATPVYWYGPTAKMKLLIDRLRPYISSRKLAGKKGLVVSPSEEGASCCGPLLQMFTMSFEYLGMLNGGSLLAQAYEKGEIIKRPEELHRAREKGLSL